MLFIILKIYEQIKLKTDAHGSTSDDMLFALKVSDLGQIVCRKVFYYSVIQQLMCLRASDKHYNVPNIRTAVHLLTTNIVIK